MPNTNKKYLVLFLTISILFVFGVVKLFTLRFEAGDVYPPYSSLRSDPLGTKALYFSLSELLPGTIHRNYRPFSHLTAAPNTTVFYLGAFWDRMNVIQNLECDFFNTVLDQGGRIVVSFFPTKNTASLKTVKKPAKKLSQFQPENNEKQKHPLPEQWGFDVGYLNKGISLKKAVSTYTNSQGTRFPDLSWHTTLYFTNLDEHWNTIYSHNNLPVVIEKKSSAGTIVLCADSYFFSNEALRSERHPDVLVWCVGNSSQVIFDESHLGIHQSIGIADLIRKYYLLWIVAGFVLFSALFIWKNATYFVPPLQKERRSDVNILVDTKDHTDALITLIQRNFGKKDLLKEGLFQWKKSFITHKNAPKELYEKFKQVEIMVLEEHISPQKDANPVKMYHAVHDILYPRKPL